MKPLSIKTRFRIGAAVILLLMCTSSVMVYVHLKDQAADHVVFKTIRVLAESDVTVLILGETGSGKELAARAIHACGRRRGMDITTVNCPALPETILESELFGHRKGAFTSAGEDRPGLLDRADGGTIFLDEIGDLGLAVQTKLLRVLQDKKIKPLGANDSHRVDARIIAATNQDLEAPTGIKPPTF